MTTLAQGATATVTLAVGETVAIATNGGRWWTTVTPAVGPAVGPSSHLTQTHRTFGPLTGGGTVAITNQTVDTLVYIQTGAGVVSAPVSTTAGSSTTVALGDQGSVAVANPGGYWSAAITPAIGAASLQNNGPAASNTVFGPYPGGASVTLANITGGPLVSVARNQGGVSASIGGNTFNGSTLTLVPGSNPTPTSWQWTRNGSNISGQTASTYQLTATDNGTTIACQVNGGAYSAAINIPAVANNLPAVASIVGIGDSITFGYNLAQGQFPAAQRWLNIVGAAMGATVLNQGVSGTVLQNSNDSGGAARSQNMRDRFVADMTGANQKAFAIIAGGFNDARYTAAPATFNVTQYGLQLRQMLSGLVIQGYATNRICVVSPYFITDTGLVTGSAGFTGQTRTGFEMFVAQARAAAVEYGAFYADTYAGMQTFGSGALIDPADNIHPLIPGHGAIANIVEGATVLNANAQAVVSATGGTASFTYSITPVANATSYTLEYAVDGTFAFGNTQVVAASGTISGVTASTYRVRARANFGDGTSTPWGFSAAITVASAGGSATFLQETFTGTAGTALTALTPTTGGAWALQTGYTPASPAALDSAGTALFSPTSTGVYQNAGTPNASDYYVEAVLNMVSVVTAPTNDNVGVTARADTAANTFYFARYLVGSGWQLFKTVAGTSTQLGTTQADAWTTGTRTVRLTVAGTTISVQVGGSTIISVTDASVTATGKAGVRFGAQQSSTTGIHMTSIVAST